MSDQIQKTPYTFSYAELLTTASTLMTLDHCLNPWFSNEIRSSLDPRVKWFKAHDSEQHQQSHKAAQQVPPLSTKEAKLDQQIEEVNKAGEAVAGHYLDHIESVQQRDTKGSSSRRRRRRKSAKSTNSRKETNTSPEPKLSSSQSSKRRRRSSRGRKIDKPSQAHKVDE